MTTAINPGIMPQRRPVQTTTPMLVAPVRVRGREGEHIKELRTASTLRATIADSNPTLAYRPACDHATTLIENYGAEVPTGKKKQRWLDTTIANVAALIETWFGLETMSTKLNVSPGAVSIARRIFVETCIDYKITGTPGQQTDWYSKLREETLKARKTAKAERAAAVVIPTKETRGQTVSSRKEEPMTLTQVFEEAAGYLERYAQTVVGRRNGERGRRLPSSILTIATTLLNTYFTGNPDKGAEEQLSDSTVNIVRSKFAYACIKHHLRGTPGQQTDWYSRVEATTRRYIESRRI